MSSRIDRIQVREAFADYTSAYDVNDEKIRLKIDHTYRVAELCEQIAKSLCLSEEDVDVAWLLGMLHDVGRFEQLRRYGTFADAKSIDHAQFGADILFRDEKIRDYLPGVLWSEEFEFKLLETAIRCHSAYRIPEGLDERTRMFCNILRDADKIDIFRVNMDVPLEAIYNVTTEELRSCEVSEGVLKSFEEEHATLRSLKKTPVDHVAGHISLVFELVFPISVRLVKEQGYLDGLLQFESDCPKTRNQFIWMRERVNQFMDERVK